MKNSGFTLVELLVVMLILGILTHLAMRSANTLVSAKRAEAAATQLAEIKAAAQAFALDMGRAPRTLDELWSQPSDTAAFAVRTTSDGTLVACGWHGPYLELPHGKTALYDPWGNDFVLTTNDSALATIGHRGADGRDDATVAPTRPEERDDSISLELGPSTLFVQPAVFTASGAEIAAGSTVNVLWYGASDTTAPTSGAAVVAYPAPAQFTALPPLSCYVRLAVGSTTGALHRVALCEGDNLFSTELHLP